MICWTCLISPQEEWVEEEEVGLMKCSDKGW